MRLSTYRSEFAKQRLTDTGEDSKLVHRRKSPKVDTLFSYLSFRRFRATSTSQRRVENTRVHFWTFSPGSVKVDFFENHLSLQSDELFDFVRMVVIFFLCYLVARKNKKIVFFKRGKSNKMTISSRSWRNFCKPAQYSSWTEWGEWSQCTQVF